jgi:hypothetical protein
MTNLFFRSISRFLITSLSLSICLIASVYSQQPSETQVKGAFIFNFIKYVEWENEGNMSELVVGIYGDNNPLYEELSNAIAGSTIRNKQIRVIRVDGLSQAGN